MSGMIFSLFGGDEDEQRAKVGKVGKVYHAQIAPQTISTAVLLRAAYRSNTRLPASNDLTRVMSR